MADNSFQLPSGHVLFNFCVIFLFLFECCEDEISSEEETAKKLQTRLGQFEHFTIRYIRVV